MPVANRGVLSQGSHMYATELLGNANGTECNLYVLCKLLSSIVVSIFRSVTLLLDQVAVYLQPMYVRDNLVTEQDNRIILHFISAFHC